MKKVLKSILLIFVLTADIFLAIYFLPEEIAKTYIALSTIGKSIFFFSEILAFFVKKFIFHLFSFLILQAALFFTFTNYWEQSFASEPYLHIYILIPMCLGLLRVFSHHKLLLPFIFGIYHFFVPQKTSTHTKKDYISEKSIAAVIPAYMPDHMTISLIKSILLWHPNVLLVVVDDNTPFTDKTTHTLYELNKLSQLHKNLHLIRSQTNKLKAGALNQGLAYLYTLPNKPDAVFTLDDDIEITKDTIPNMLLALYEDEKIGAVCSQVRISNKNKNLLTRIQSLEYHSFNITKIADTGFVLGPLVMQGMLTGFRMEVLEETKGFIDGHLIEDYDITARVKIKGWKVKIAQNAMAWTLAPETIKTLWKQRARWTSGGLYVLASYWKSPSAVYQDIIGHGLFLLLFTLVFLSFVFTNTHATAPMLTSFVLISAFMSLSFTLIYNFAVILTYPDRDIKDWLIKAAIIPEFVYANFLSLILIVSYIYTVYMFLIRLGISGFANFGFSSNWGTRR